MGIIIAVRSVFEHESPFDNHKWRIEYASQTAAEDGSFRTERIPPGKYLLVADAYTPISDEQRLRTGLIGPSHHAQVTIDVPIDGELTVDDFVLKPVRSGE